jgi:hypothetical protein
MGLVMAGIIFLMSIAGCSLWTLFQNGGRRIVRASKPIFLWLICLGTMLMGSSLIPLSLGDEVFEFTPRRDRHCLRDHPVAHLLGMVCVVFCSLFKDQANPQEHILPATAHQASDGSRQKPWT